MKSMRRTLHHLFTILSALSLLLCVATGWLWLDSERGGGRDWAHGTYPDDSLQLNTYGHFEATRNRVRPGVGPEVYHDWYVLGNRLGLSTDNAPNFYSWSFRSPFYVPMGLAGLLPALWLWCWRRGAPQARAGCYASCGYDLRASPECGTAMDAGVTILQ